MKDYLSTQEFYARIPDEASCREYIGEQRWEIRLACLLCGNEKVWEINDGMGFKFGDCPPNACRFSVRTGTVMEKSRVSLQNWRLAIHMMTTACKEFSSVQFAKHLGVTQKTAWNMEHGIRNACEDETPMLSGDIEINETYIGGRRANMGNAKRKALADNGRSVVGDAAVIGMKEHGGNVVAIPVAQTNQETLLPIVNEIVEQDSNVYIEGSKSYVNLNNAFDHESVSHSASEYVWDNAHTNSIESLWVLIKRGYYGTHHLWSCKHVHRYVAEYVYCQN
ncbi:MAG: IS1595 family transposase [Bacteroidota bacterium]|nr:IS1595 family transposase [Bacteroidota bacterium]